MSSNTFKVGLLGHGTVGAAFAELVKQRADEIQQLTGKRPEISGVLTRSQGSFSEILQGSDVVVELMGGLEPTREYVLEALAAGKHVITANKQLLSHHGEELWALARKQGVHLGFEAAVGGVVPVIRVLRDALAGAEVERVLGIVNGTTNFILTEMARTGADYKTVLAQAQQLGYAEADPSEDVGGKDAAAKMAILARLAFGTPVTIDQVQYEGIEQITADDLAYAHSLGLSLKLIGTAERNANGIAVSVNPSFLYGGHPLASVEGPFNAVTIESQAITEITVSGPGAGGSQTASAVLGDLVEAITSPRLIPETKHNLAVVNDRSSAFYLSLKVDDQPGVLAQTAEVFAQAGVSIKSVLQTDLQQGARLVMVSHPAAESAFFSALESIAQLPCVQQPPRAIRVIEEEFV